MNLKLVRGLLVFASGLLFAAGLVLSGMTKPAKVAGFLDVTGAWDPSLMFVMVGAIGVHAILFRVITRRATPVLGGTFHIPAKKPVDARLVVGSVIFGVGWGLTGICPGPGLVALLSTAAPFVTFVGAMLVGTGLFSLWERLTTETTTTKTTTTTTA